MNRVIEHKRRSAQEVMVEKNSFAALIAFMMIVAFAPISSAVDQKIKARVPGIT